MVKDARTNKTSRPVVFALSNEQCVWARAGVAKPMRCINAFDCLHCAFDQKIIRDFEAKELEAGTRGIEHNTPRMRMLMSGRKCRHMLSGLVSYKLCAHGFDCARCPYDQMIEDTSLTHPVSAPHVENASGFHVGAEHYYHRGHTWARLEYGGRVRVGIDDFANRLMGPADQIKTPDLGDNLAQGEPQAELIREGQHADTMAPVEGTVVAVNPKAAADPAAINDSPYEDGWLMVIQPTKLRPNLKNLLYGDESLAWMDEEASRLSSLMAQETGYPLAATGGEVVRDIYGAAPQVGWDKLVREFLNP